MMSPLTICPDTIVELPLSYCGSIPLYCAAAASGGSVIDCRRRYNKRLKETHRATIIDTHGELRLTVPITLPEIEQGRAMTWEDVEVSAHGHWWSIHLTALESGYGHTPFFQFYIDRFAPLLTSRYEHERVKLWQLDRDFSDIIASILGISAPIYITRDNPLDDAKQSIVRPIGVMPAPRQVEYYQVMASKHGFKPSMSILDLIFNMGPEAPLVLKDMIG